MFHRLQRLRAESPRLLIWLALLHAAVLGLAVWKLCAGRWGHVGLCLLTLLLFQAPPLTEVLTKLRVPPLLEAAVTAFAFCANILGEMLGFYLRFLWWDAALHVLWGFLAGLLGCAFLQALQGQPLKRPASALTALGFAALTGICWEFFEFAMDVLFHMDMQKDVWLHSVSSLLLNKEGANAAVTEALETVTVNGEAWPGIPDVGLRDTVSDLFLNFIGSLAAAALLLADGRGGRRTGLPEKLMPTPFGDGKDRK